MVTAADIAREIGNDGDLKRKSKVVAFTDLPGVPEGTRGLVTLVNGWGPWIRYRVLFDNGADLGSIDREHLAPVKQYGTYAEARTQALESGVFDRVEAAADEVGADGGGGDAGAAGATVNGVAIPAHLLERSKSARARLGAG